MRTTILIWTMSLMLFGSYVHSSLTYVHPRVYREITEKERSEVRKWNRVHGVYSYITVPGVGTYFERDGKKVWVKREDREAVKRWTKRRTYLEAQAKSRPKSCPTSS